MTTYRLPDALGGGEAELVEWKTDGYPSWATLEIDGVPVIVPHEHLVEVAPPPPPEPPVGSIVHLASYFGVYERVERGWLIAGEATGRAVEWDMLLRLNSGNAPARLVPDPFAAPIELPWAYEDTTSSVHPTLVRIGADGCWAGEASIRLVHGNHAVVAYVPARLAARALWAAADVAEAKP